MLKFYFKVDTLNNDKPLSLYYVDYSDYSEKRFDKATLSWVPTDKVYYAVISGDLDYEQTTLEKAKEFAPDAFIGDQVIG